MSIIFNIIFLIVFFAHPLLADDSLDIKQRLERIERDILDIQKDFYSGNSKSSNNESDFNSSSEITVFDMRLRDIENELKNINLNYENLSFEIDELKKIYEELSINLNTLIINSSETSKAEAKDQVVESEFEEKVKSETDEPNTLGTLKINTEDLSDQNQDQDIENVIQSSPDESFQAAFDLLRAQKFNEAKNALELFISSFPDNELTGSAHYWLGEIFLLKKEDREAALVFAEGYQKFPNSVKAPESLYKLAEALLKIEKKTEACDTLKQFILKYPNNRLVEKTESKIAENNCN